MNKEGWPFRRRMLLLLWIAIDVFVLLEFVGGHTVFWKGYDLMDNAQCFKYLGCNVGFFGYDAIVHFSSGIMEASFMLWLAVKSGHFNIFHEQADDTCDHGHYRRLKNWIILLSVLVIIGFAWEMGEFAFDHYRMMILHEQLLVPDHLAQASNDDTMGDIFCGITGGMFGGLISKLLGSEVL